MEVAQWLAEEHQNFLDREPVAYRELEVCRLVLVAFQAPSIT